MKKILSTLFILFMATASLAQQDTTRSETIRLPLPKESIQSPSDDLDGDGEVTSDEIKISKLYRSNNCARILLKLTDMRLGYEESTPSEVEIWTNNFADYNCAEILGRPLKDYLPK